MPTVTPFLMFDDQAEEAVNLYVSLFRDSKILSVNRYGEGAPLPAGTVMGVSFMLDGREYQAFNGGPHFVPSDAFSLFVSCDTQAEVDALWDKLSAGGEKGQCGWLKDKFGISWQIIPTALMRLMGDPDPVKSKNVMQAMLQMSKIEIAGLQRAYDKE